MEPFDEDPEDPDGDRKKGAAQWSAHDALPLVVLTLCALILVVLVATGARMHEPTMYDLAAKLLWKNPGTCVRHNSDAKLSSRIQYPPDEIAVGRKHIQIFAPLNF